MFGKLENAQMKKWFAENTIGRLGCHADGRTYVVPISYAYDSGLFMPALLKAWKFLWWERIQMFVSRLMRWKTWLTGNPLLPGGHLKSLPGEEERNGWITKINSAHFTRNFQCNSKIISAMALSYRGLYSNRRNRF